MNLFGKLPVLSGVGGGCTGYPIAPGMHSIDGFNYIDVQNGASLPVIKSTTNLVSYSSSGLYKELICLAFALVFVGLVLEIIGKVFVLNKLDDNKGWKVFVPFYGTYTLFKKTDNTFSYWLCLGSSILACFITSEFWSSVCSFVSLITYVDMICSLTKLYLGKEASYGEKLGFSLIWLFFAPVFWLILGLSENPLKEKTVEENTEEVKEEPVETKFEPIEADVEDVKKDVEEVTKDLEDEPKKKTPSKKTSTKKTTEKKTTKTVKKETTKTTRKKKAE